MPAQTGPSQALGSCLVLKKSKVLSKESSKEPSIKVQHDLTLPSLFPGSYTQKILHCLHTLSPPPMALSQSNHFITLLLSSWILPDSLGSFLFMCSPLHIPLFTSALFCPLLKYHLPFPCTSPAPMSHVTSSQPEEFSFFECHSAWLFLLQWHWPNSTLNCIICKMLYLTFKMINPSSL